MTIRIFILFLCLATSIPFLEAFTVGSFPTVGIDRQGHWQSLSSSLSMTASSSSSSSSTTAASATTNLRVASGIEEVAKDHDVFLLDMWGVMHDGTNPYEGVLDTVQKLKEAGKEMIILSNSSKRIDSSIKMLRKLGFEPDDFSQIITSGEVSTTTMFVVAGSCFVTSDVSHSSYGSYFQVSWTRLSVFVRL